MISWWSDGSITSELLQQYQIGDSCSAAPSDGPADGQQGRSAVEVLSCAIDTPVGPPGVSLDANIAVAKAHFGNAIWFRNQVRGRGPWDYKQLGRQYENFGNYHFGATGAAVGFPLRTMLREAGRAQIAAGTSREEWGHPGNRLNPFGGIAPFGDDPADQHFIARGFGYFLCIQNLARK